MSPNIVKSAAFIAPLAGLALVMGWGERSESVSCSRSFAFEKARQILEAQPGVLEIATQTFRPMEDCRFAMAGYADIEAGAGAARRRFELVMIFEPAARRWKHADLSLTE